MVRRKRKYGKKNRKSYSGSLQGKQRNARDLRVETLEDRVLLATDFRLASIQTNDSQLLTSGERLTSAPSDVTLVFSKGSTVDPATLGGIEVVRSGFDGVFDNGNDVAVAAGFVGQGDESNEVVVRFAEALVDDAYQIRISGSLLNDCGVAFNDGSSQTVPFEVDLGAQVVAVVPQPITQSGSTLSQARNQIDVYFNNDDLNPSLAQDPTFYQLIFTNDTVTNTDDSDAINPTSVAYDASTDHATLTFATDIEDLAPGTGTYRLRIGNTAGRTDAPVDLTPAEPIDAGSTISNANADFGALGGTPQLISGAISPLATADAANLAYPGSENDPGHRLVSGRRDQHVTFEDVNPGSIETFEYNFRSVYGIDGFGNPISNQITELQKERAREVLDVYSYYLGIQFVETPSSGFTIATGDVRSVRGDFAQSFFGFGDTEGGVAGTSTILVGGEDVEIDVAVMNGAQQWNEAYGESWYVQAMQEIGHLLGYGEANDLPNGTLFDVTNTLFQVGPQQDLGRLPEDVFPSPDDIVHGRHLYHDNSNDVDMYRFTLSEPGLFSAETFAERAAAPSTLDTMLRLFQDTPAGPRPISQNNDYFGKDSYVEMELSAGTYYVAVSSTGNDQYNALFESGAGGTSSGDYQLRVEFQPSAGSGLLDTTGRQFDGDADGQEGGDYNFWFRAADEADTLYVNNSASAGGVGSLGAPFNTIKAAMDAAAAGGIVRVVGNDASTNNTYGIGFDNLGNPLSDGSADGALRVEKDVVLMIDAGAILKLRRGSILVGSDSSVVDRSGGSIQVLGTPDAQVIFTSVNDTSVGIDIDPLSLPAKRGDWGGIQIRRDVDNASGFLNYENEGIFLDYINNTEMMFGGGVIPLGSVSTVINPISLIDARPAVSHNTLTFNADAAISATPNSFRETNFRAPEFQSVSFTPDYGRIGPDIHNNLLVENTTNGLFISGGTGINDGLTLEASGRWNDTDIVHVLTDTLLVNGSPGGLLVDSSGFAMGRPSGRLMVDPGVVVKSEGGRIEVGIGATMLAEGTADQPVVFTSLQDMRYGAGGTFDTNRGLTNIPSPEDWGGIMARPTSQVSLDHAVLAYGGGTSRIEGAFASFNVLEVHQADLRVVNSVLEFNGAGTVSTIIGTRVGRGANESGTIYVRGARPILLENVFRHNSSAVANIDVNSLSFHGVTDTGRSTGEFDASELYLDNQGPLIRGNVVDSNGLNGMVIRGGTLSTESVWDDTDIVHVLRDNVFVPNHHSYGGLRLKSSPTESLVIKALGEEAGFVTTGTAIGIPDHIGGSIQVLGQPGNPVIMTSLFDDTVGAGVDQNGQTQVDTNGGGRPVRTTAPGQPGSTQIDINFGPNIQLFPEVIEATRLAADVWEENLQDNVTIILDIDLAPQESDMGLEGFPGAGVLTTLNANNFDTFNLFDTSPIFGAFGYTAVQSALVADAGDHEATVKQLPSASQLNVEFPLNSAVPFAVADDMLLTRANALALGLSVGAIGQPSAYDVEDAAIDGTILINDNLDLFDFDRTNGLKNYREDFQTQMLAQIGEILGFESNLTTVSFNLQNPPDGGGAETIDVSLTPLDLFRLAPGEGQEDFRTAARRMDPQQEDHVFYAGGELDYRGYPFEAITVGDIPIGTGYAFFRVTDELNDIFANRWRDDQFFRNGERLSFDMIGVMDQASLLRDNIFQTNDSTINTRGMMADLSEADRLAFDSIGWDVVGGAPGDWQGIRLEELTHDGNIEYVTEREGDVDANRLPATAQPLGNLAENRNAGNEELRLGFEIHGTISNDSDVDVYSFNAIAGTDIWIDIDNASGTLDSMVELIGSDQSVLAASDDSAAESLSGELTGSAEPLGTVDLFTTNVLDAGMKVRLPGPRGLESTYFVQVRTPQTGSSGRYELQVRMQGRDEVPGTSIQFADIRYAETGIQIIGPPSDSPLVGEQVEDESLNDYHTEISVATIGDDDDPANRYVDIGRTVASAALPYEVSAQRLGNLSATKQGAISVFGSLQDSDFGFGFFDSGDVDWYRFDVLATDRQFTNFEVVFDIDYADGLGGPDTVMAVYRESFSIIDSGLAPQSRRLTPDPVPELIYYSESSNVADDLVSNLGTSDVITGGSFGTRDPFIGPVNLFAGTYFVAISSIATIPQIVETANVDENNIFVDAVPGDSGRGRAIDPTADFDRTVPLHVPNSNAPFNVITEGEYQLEIRYAPNPGQASSVSTDENRERIQGQIVIANNTILDSRTFGVSVEDAFRDHRIYGGELGEVDFNEINFRRSSSFRGSQHSQFNTGDFAPHAGPPRALPGLNEERVVPGITVANNVIAGGFDGGINMQGDPNGIVLDVYNLNSLFEADSADGDDYGAGDLDQAEFSIWDHQGNIQEFQFTSSGTTDPDKIPIRFDADEPNDGLHVNNELFNTNVNNPTLATSVANEIIHALRLSDLDIKVYKVEGVLDFGFGFFGAGFASVSEIYQTSEDDVDDITYDLPEQIFIEGAVKIGMPDVFSDPDVDFAFAPDNAFPLSGFNVPPITAHVAQQGAVTYARLVNNTIVGRGGDLFDGNGVGDVGIVIEDNASPTLLNNVVANFATGIRSDFSANDSNVDRRTFIGTQSSIDQSAFSTFGVFPSDIQTLSISFFGSEYLGFVLDPVGEDFLDAPGLHRDIDDSPTQFVGSRPTIIGGSVYQGNLNDTLRINTGDDAIVLDNTDPLFVDAEGGNYFLAEQSRAIDSSINSLAERDYLTEVFSNAGIATTGIVAPDIDGIGILRVDDPDVAPPIGSGSNVFKDRGALERGDFVGPTATISNPEDNSGIDSNPSDNAVAILGEALTFFEIKLGDGATLANPVFGSGIDDRSVVTGAIAIRRDDETLVEAVDYTLAYDATNDTLRVIPTAGVWVDGTYEIELLNTDPNPGDEIDLFIRDKSGNPLRANQADGRTVLRIDIGSGTDYGDAPAPYPTRAVDDGAVHEFSAGFFLGSSVTIEIDAAVNGNATADAGDDGVALPAKFTKGTTSDVVITASAAGFVNAWIDWNTDGMWTSDEQVLTGEAVNAGTTTLEVATPSFAVASETFARFRFSSLDVLAPTGLAPNGEVEDYLVSVGINPWQNPTDRFDVLDNGAVGPLDALEVINELNSPVLSEPGTGALPPDALPGQVPPYVDVSGDGFVSPIDALLVINQLDAAAPAAASSAGTGFETPQRSGASFETNVGWVTQDLNQPYAFLPVIGEDDDDEEFDADALLQDDNLFDIFDEMAEDVTEAWQA